jgi:hypothetical protein
MTEIGTAMGRTGKLGVVLAVFLFVTNAFSIPVKPNIEKILKQQEQRQRTFEPARAGWDGPEMVRPQEASPNPVYEAYGPASTVRAIRASLRAAATPDPVAILGIGMLILLLRLTRHHRTQRQRAAVLVISNTNVDSGERRAA